MAQAEIELQTSRNQLICLITALSHFLITRFNKENNILLTSTNSLSSLCTCHTLANQRATLTLYVFAGSAPGQFDRPIGVTTTECEVIVADTWNHRLQVFDLGGNFVRTIGKRGQG